MKLHIKAWLRAAGIRALKTVAQTAVSMIPVGVSVEEVGWLAVLGTAALAGICSLLTSVAGLPEVKTVNEDGEELSGGYDGEDGV
ncbi:MAG: hypothetical protein E7630_03240 [Ruminococcaceae bacterium]|nr:hypothetical protein [Oscillospiraceae bacterium]